MSVAEFILVMVGTLVWPIVFLVAVYRVCRVVRDLLTPAPPVFPTIPPQPTIRPLSRDMMETRELKPVPPGVEGYNPSLRRYKEH